MYKTISSTYRTILGHKVIQQTSKRATRTRKRRVKEKVRIDEDVARKNYTRVDAKVFQKQSSRMG